MAASCRVGGGEARREGEGCWPPCSLPPLPGFEHRAGTTGKSEELPGLGPGFPHPVSLSMEVLPSACPCPSCYRLPSSSSVMGSSCPPTPAGLLEETVCSHVGWRLQWCCLGRGWNWGLVGQGLQGKKGSQGLSHVPCEAGTSEPCWGCQERPGLPWGCLNGL